MSAIPVFCFPPAGAGASFYHTWRGFSTTLDVLPVELPGREKRYDEPLPGDLRDLAAQLAGDLAEAASTAGRIVLFGHSFGSVLAYETALVLLAREPGLDLTLVVSGSPGPWTLRGRRIATLPDDEFVAGVREISGYHHPALDDPELRDLLLPTLRADVVMHEAYHSTHGDEPREPLPANILSIRGIEDEVVDEPAAREWARIAGRTFRLEQVPGGHMYLVDSWPGLLRLIQRRLPSVPVTA
ncbi:thioesterase II family protein [Micromonospora siamensis]|uniref:Surfactin synthase thioesterase subunit n=1 Tax=Micromonospora siamensis TaxID=299152 RepID=A0A1C5HEF8_9ACTN|nr:alpha/beta fold hydrolase [Micromonospora siamensis]SCG44439.1 Surfactin synthase thioesterase subunit [Micromonospora siamensis]